MNPIAVSITAAVLVAALLGMALSWHRRGVRQRAFALPTLPERTGEPRVVADGLYLATTFAGRPLDRVVVGGLGFRAEARITVTDAGVLVTRAGEPDLYLGADRLLGAGSGTWTLDRAVEPGGLTVLGWRIGDGDAAAEVESSFRIGAAARPRLEAAVRDLVPARPEVPHGDA